MTRLSLILWWAVGLTCSLLAQPAPAPGLDPVRVDERTEEVLRAALKWMASQQSPNGAWAGSDQEKQHPVAITGYALMAFLACGQLPGEGEYGRNVSAGLNYLADNVGPEGHIGNRNDGQYMYGHGIATIALAELYGQSKAPGLRSKLERAVRLIIASQNREGGWRYRPVSYNADISVTVLQVVALRSAKNAGLAVPQRVLDNAVQYVKSCYLSSEGAFAYQPGQGAGFARTAAAIYSLQVCGLYDDPMVRKGSEYLLTQFKESGLEWWTYGNFYAAPAQYMRGGATWAKWYAQLNKALLGKVIRKGDLAYWEFWEGERNVGPLYTTAVNTTILAMPYHYTPLYQR